MIHILTMGHLDPTAVGRRQAIVLRPLDMGIVNRLLQELGGTDEQGRPTLDDVPVEIKDGTVACRWLIGGYCNLVAEEFAPAAPGGDGLRAGRPGTFLRHRARAAPGAEPAANCHPRSQRAVGGRSYWKRMPRIWSSAHLLAWIAPCL